MIIKGEFLENLEIHEDGESGFVLKSQNGIYTDKKSGKERPTYKVYGYYSSVSGAMKAASKVLAHRGLKEITPTQYLKRLESVLSTIKEAVTVFDNGR